MNRNILKITLFALAITGLCSCSDSFFEQYPSNNVTKGNHYKTDNDFNQGVYACYQKVKTQMGFFLNELAYRSDECVLESMAVSTQDRYDLDHFQEKANNGILSDVWDAWYNGIYRCNDLLVNLEGKEGIKNAAQYRGEALFLRSWWYFNLYNTFGGVPLTTTVVSPAEAKTIARCSDEQMFSRLSADLSEAAELLPVKRSAEKARVTRIAAQALLGKVYLTFGKYPEAEAVLKEALSDSGYGLMGTTGEVFDVANKMNREIIFAIYYDKTNDNGHGYWYSANTGVLADITNPTPAFKALYESADNRLPLISTYTKIKSTLYSMKKWDDTYDSVYTTQVGNDFPILRFADVVLMYAEALGMQGNITGALEYLNKTRTRAGIAALTETDVPDKTAFVKALADERGREFALEGHRWLDLKRLGLAVDFFKGMGYSVDSHELVFPIPQDQIEIVNNSAILWQNAGY